jgi:hypothetical protein
MDDEGDLVYATVPNFTDVTDDSDKLQLNGKLEVTDEVEANQLSIGTGASNFNGQTTFMKKLFVRDGLENTDKSKTFKWGGVTIQNDVLNSPTVTTTGSITAGGSITATNKNITASGTGQLIAGNKICINTTCITEDLLKTLNFTCVFPISDLRTSSGRRELEYTKTIILPSTVRQIEVHRFIKNVDRNKQGNNYDTIWVELIIGTTKIYSKSDTAATDINNYETLQSRTVTVPASKRLICKATIRVDGGDYAKLTNCSFTYTCIY